MSTSGPEANGSGGQPVLDPSVFPEDRYRFIRAYEQTPEVIAGFGYDLGAEKPVFMKAKTAVSLNGHVDNSRLLSREAEVLSGLSHPGIPKILDADLESGIPYIVTSPLRGNIYVPRWIKEFSRPRFAAKIILSALDALSYVHDHGITHGDIKTKNLVMSCGSEAGIVDFEQSVIEADSDEGKVMQSATLEYAPPEVFTDRKVTPLSDIYSAGITLFELAMGRVPYKENNYTAYKLAHCHDIPDFSGHLDRNLSFDLMNIIDIAMSKKPKDRYQSAGEMAEDLLRYLAT